MNILCFMLMTLRHVYSRGAKTKLLDISYWLVPSSRDSDIPWGQSFLVLEAVGFARAALSWDHWNKNSELEHYYQKSQGSHWHRHQSRQTRQDIFQFSAWDGKDFFEPFFLGSAGWGGSKSTPCGSLARCDAATSSLLRKQRQCLRAWHQTPSPTTCIEITWAAGESSRAKKWLTWILKKGRFPGKYVISLT